MNICRGHIFRKKNIGRIKVTAKIMCAKHTPFKVDDESKVEKVKIILNNFRISICFSCRFYMFVPT